MYLGYFTGIVSGGLGCGRCLRKVHLDCLVLKTELGVLLFRQLMVRKSLGKVC